MKESKFIELLNLYVDHEISPEDAALLEEAILQNPRRRQIYRQYCRMQRACTIVLDRAESENEAQAAPGGVVAFAAQRSSRWGYYAAGLAAAACVALVAVLSVLRSGGSAPVSALATDMTPSASMAKSMPVVASSPVLVKAPPMHFIIKTEGYLTQQARFAQAMTATSGHFILAASESDNIRLPLPVQAASPLREQPRQSIEDFVFAKDTAIPENQKIFRSRQPGEESEENMAIEFQR
jgi:hypothetical protein